MHSSPHLALVDSVLESEGPGLLRNCVNWNVLPWPQLYVRVSDTVFGNAPRLIEGLEAMVCALGHATKEDRAEEARLDVGLGRRQQKQELCAESTGDGSSQQRAYEPRSRAVPPLPTRAQASYLTIFSDIAAQTEETSHGRKFLSV